MVPPPRWSTPEHLARAGTISNGLTAYATSKLGVIYLVHAFARRTGLETYSFNPAFTPGTDLMRDNRVGDTFFRQVGPRLPRVNTQEQAGAIGSGNAAGLSGPQRAFRRSGHTSHRGIELTPAGSLA